MVAVVPVEVEDDSFVAVLISLDTSSLSFFVCFSIFVKTAGAEEEQLL